MSSLRSLRPHAPLVVSRSGREKIAVKTSESRSWKRQNERYSSSFVAWETARELVEIEEGVRPCPRYGTAAYGAEVRLCAAGSLLSGIVEALEEKNSVDIMSKYLILEIEGESGNVSEKM